MATLTPLIRTATEDDAQAISNLISKTWSEFNAHTVCPSDLSAYLAGPLSPSSILLDIQNPSTRFLITTSQTTIIAVAQLTLSPSPPECVSLPKPIELQRLYLSSTYHGGGLGRALVNAVEDLAREEGFKSIWLGVYDGNEGGMGFYERVGFQRVGEKEFHAGSILRRDWIMQKSL
jgi:ribosomal protein S18 acetylase RimI-like enzyme